MRKIILILVLVIIGQFVYYLTLKREPNIYYKICNDKLTNLITNFIRDENNKKYETDYILLELDLSSNSGRLSYLERDYLLVFPFIRIEHIVLCKDIDNKRIIVKTDHSSNCFDYLLFNIPSVVSYINKKTPELGELIISEYNGMINSDCITLKSPLYFPKKSLYFSIDKNNNLNYNTEYNE